MNATAKWLTIVGIGEDGLSGLSVTARTAIEEAETVFGGRRHLELAAPAIKGLACAWRSPFDASMKEILAFKGRRVCVLASGDPFFHGVGVTLARHVPAHEFCIHPAPSAFSLAAARLGWTIQDIETLSLHGRPISLIRPLLHEGVRILALTSDGKAPAEIAALLSETGFGASRFLVLEALGGARERIVEHEVDKLARMSDQVPNSTAFADLNVVAVEVAAEPDAPIIPLAGMLDDDLFEHDGQITKREIRALTLSSLAPRRGELLWDIGAGSGSIGISFMLAHPSLRAIAIEKDKDRAARIRRNADNLGAPGLRVIEGMAPEALVDLPTPNAVFIGGGGSKREVMDAAMAALHPRGRLVVNAVTLKMEAMLLDYHERHGGTLTRLMVARVVPLGTMQGWRAALPVTQWVWCKP